MQYLLYACENYLELYSCNDIFELILSVKSQGIARPVEINIDHKDSRCVNCEETLLDRCHTCDVQLLPILIRSLAKGMP
jgi:hypothetical protein